jgi:hypothetical protein
VTQETKKAKEVFLDKAADIGFETTKTGRQAATRTNKADQSDSESEESSEEEVK